ncbi:hypothetical protein BPT24_027 [Tenacibaculum phage pT24]|uniref:Uncharacterized protein n=1 Tax=Tenacibaculum phage pT24 TaxID=1880590 RepID=A0A1B4XWG6_9CAUD|nr:hypothetical protein HYP10_gp027 [Tenacibaculum phage pT24]BAV39149.1 hypothetical protein BPT24_027 [Tenacibaculum phage pT24]
MIKDENKMITDSQDVEQTKQVEDGIVNEEQTITEDIKE